MTVVARTTPLAEASASEIKFVDELLLDPAGSNSWLEEREALLEHVSDMYAGVLPAVLTFLRSNSDVAWALIGARSALSKAFGGAPVRLALVADVDSVEARQQLFAYVKFAGTLEAAADALDKFDEDWLLDNASRLAGLLGFDLEF